MPTLEFLIYYFFGAVLAVSAIGSLALTYYADAARKHHKKAEARLKQQEQLLHRIKADLAKLRQAIKQKTGMQQAEARISKAISDLISIVDEQEKVVAKK